MKHNFQNQEPNCHQSDVINQIPVSNYSGTSETDRKRASSTDPTSEISSPHFHGTNIRKKKK